MRGVLAHSIDHRMLCRQARSGVQLKDKWRNLVKFNHLTTEELSCGAGGGVKTRTGLRQCVLTWPNDHRSCFVTQSC